MKASASATSRIGGPQYYRPSRVRYKGGRACEGARYVPNWQRYAALWLIPPATLLYSYQTRTALHSPCNIRTSPSPIYARLHRGHHADRIVRTAKPRAECRRANRRDLQVGVNGQLDECDAMPSRGQRQKHGPQLIWCCCRSAPTTFYFSGLVADVIVDTKNQRGVFAARRDRLVDDSVGRWRDLPPDSNKLGEALSRWSATCRGRLCVLRQSRAVEWRRPCPAGAPASTSPLFNADPQRLANVVDYVQTNSFRN